MILKSTTIVVVYWIVLIQIKEWMPAADRTDGNILHHR